MPLQTISHKLVVIPLEYYDNVYISMKSVHHLTSVFNIP